jgi:hypothetical protein
MGQIDPVPLGANLGGNSGNALGEGPLVIEIDNISHIFLL